MKSIFQQKTKRKPPPRPPPPNIPKYKSKSSFTLNQDLIEWSPPNSPKTDIPHPQNYGGSISSSYSSSTSSLTSSKKSLENDQSLFNFRINSTSGSTSPLTPTTWTSAQPQRNLVAQNQNADIPKPRIIRPVHFKKNDNEELPMPKIPAPSIPKGIKDVVTPYGIALYDFPAKQAGDLPLQVNDVVVLIRRVNSEWLYGKVCDTTGIFPENFISVEVPLPGESKIVTAQYEFKPQMSTDLYLQPGQKIKVLKEISDDWLYGESDGKVGQFPRAFVL